VPPASKNDSSALFQLTQLSHELARFRPQAAGTSTEPPLWEPFPGPQTQAFYSEADELYYGGAAGGGKSDLLLGLAFTAHRRSIIFRREYPQLAGLIDRSKEIVEDDDLFNASSNRWNLPGGRVLEFGAVQYEYSKQKYQGRPHDLKAFDELVHFTQSQYRFLIAWNRTSEKGQRCRTVAAGNPPTPGQEGAWIIEEWAPWLDPHFPNPAEPGELRWYAMLDGKLTWVDGPAHFERTNEKGKLETVQPRSRTFIRARVEDNPVLMESGYDAVLESLPEPLRSQLRFGDFNAEGEDDPFQVIPTAWIRLAQKRWLENAERPLGPLDCLGVDVARGGRDKTVLALRHGVRTQPLLKHPGKSTPDGQAVATLVIDALQGEAARVNIDPIGVGTSPLDILRDNGVDVAPINFAEASTATDRTGKYRMRNLRAEAHWKLREALDPVSGDGLELPPDTELLADLCAPRWKLTVGGILIESKLEIVARIGRSPDCGEAVINAYFLPAMQVAGKHPPANPIALASGSNYNPHKVSTSPGGNPLWPQR
jgi:hypothetical protein